MRTALYKFYYYYYYYYYYYTYTIPKRHLPKLAHRQLLWLKKNSVVWSDFCDVDLIVWFWLLRVWLWRKWFSKLNATVQWKQWPILWRELEQCCVIRSLRIELALDCVQLTFECNFAVKNHTLFFTVIITKQLWVSLWWRHGDIYKGKGKGRYSSSFSELWECHLPNGITQCYLPPYTSERAPPNPSHAGGYSIYLPQRDGRLSWPSWIDSAPGRESNQRPFHHESDAQPLQHQANQRLKIIHGHVVKASCKEQRSVIYFLCAKGLSHSDWGCIH